MAIRIFPEKPTLGERWGTGLGEGLEALAKQKIEGLQKKNMLSSLLGANVPKNVATALVNAPKSLQREMFKPLLKINKLKEDILERATPGGSKRNIGNLYNIRKQLLSNMKSGKIQPDAMRGELSRLGVMPEEIDILLGTELNDGIVRYFLDKTNNNPKKARKLAKKFGYKV